MYEQQFNTYLNEKYDNPDGDHHYEIAQTSGDTSSTIDVYSNALYTGDTDFYSSATIVTNREYEEREQDKKKIKLIDPNFIDQFVEEFEILAKESVI